MSLSTHIHRPPAVVYMAPSIGELFKQHRELNAPNDSISLDSGGDGKLMLQVFDVSLQCEAIAPTSLEHMQYIVMILSAGVVAQYRLTCKPDTLDRVPIIVNMFEHEVTQVIGVRAIDPDYRIILAAREEERDEYYREVYFTFGVKLMERFTAQLVTCHEYKDGSALRAAFIGTPYGWPDVVEQTPNKSFMKIYYNEGVKQRAYSARSLT